MGHGSVETASKYLHLQFLKVTEPFTPRLGTAVIPLGPPASETLA